MKNSKIAYYPKVSGSNAYTLRFREILSRSGAVSLFDFRSFYSSFFKLKFRRYDSFFVNWIDSGLINRKGNVGVVNTLIVFLKLALFKIISKKVIFIRHNFYPHDVNEDSISKAKKYVDKIERFCGNAIVHSPLAVSEYRIYIPHPLYKYPIIRNELPSTIDLDTYIIFGRITKYKRIEDVINIFPKDKKLIVAGSCEDIQYVNYLKSISGDNIIINDGYITDADAVKLISRTQGVIINHSERDMIVSGSFFYALTLGMRILCVETEFMNWVSRSFGTDVVITYPNVVSLIAGLNEIPDRMPYNEKLITKINDDFGDEAIHLGIENLL